MGTDRLAGCVTINGACPGSGAPLVIRGPELQPIPRLASTKADAIRNKFSTNLSYDKPEVVSMLDSRVDCDENFMISRGAKP
jgi:hypothetical protein